MNWLHRPGKRLVKKEEEQKQQEFFNRVRKNATLVQERAKTSLDFVDIVKTGSQETHAATPLFVNNSAADLIFLAFGKGSPCDRRVPRTEMDCRDQNNENIKPPEILFRKELRPSKAVEVIQPRSCLQQEESPIMIRSPERPLSVLNRPTSSDKSICKRVAFSDTVHCVSSSADSFEQEGTPSSGRGSYNAGTPTEIGMLLRAMKDASVSTPLKRNSSLEESPFVSVSKRKFDFDDLEDEPKDEEESECNELQVDCNEVSPRKKLRSESNSERKLLLKRQLSQLNIDSSEASSSGDRSLEVAADLAEVMEGESTELVAVATAIPVPHAEISLNTAQKQCVLPDRSNEEIREDNIVLIDHIDVRKDQICTVETGEDGETSCELEDVGSCSPESQTASTAAWSDSGLSDIVEECVDRMLAGERLQMNVLYQQYRMEYFHRSIFYVPTTSYTEFNSFRKQ